MIDTMFFGRHLEEDERIAAVFHKYWLIGVKNLLLPSASFLASWWLLWILYSREATRFWLFLAGIWAVVSVIWWIQKFFDYYLDAWIITTHGIIDVAWHGFFHRESARVLYSDIQGVSYEIKGVWGTLLRFGTVSVEKISTGSAISLEFVSRPRKVESLILQNMETYLHAKNLKDSSQVQDLLAAMVAEQIQRDSLPRKG